MCVLTICVCCVLIQVLQFKSPLEVDAWLMANPLQTPGALHFMDRNATVMSYGIQTNSTPEMNRGRFEDPTFKFQIPLQVAAEREIARSLIGGYGYVLLLLFFVFLASGIKC